MIEFYFKFLFGVIALLWQLSEWLALPLAIFVAIYLICHWVDDYAEQRDRRLREIIREEMSDRD